jgi:predicted XRE-type DNA-binding protein
MSNSKVSRASIEIEKSSGNVFLDLGLPNPEEKLVKSDLAIQIIKLIKNKELNQQEAASLLGIDQPKISALSRGRLSGFSVERLFKFLSILNQEIEIIIKPKNENNIRAFSSVCVRYANPL